MGPLSPQPFSVVEGSMWMRSGVLCFRGFHGSPEAPTNDPSLSLKLSSYLTPGFCLKLENSLLSEVLIGREVNVSSSQASRWRSVLSAESRLYAPCLPRWCLSQILLVAYLRFYCSDEVLLPKFTEVSWRRYGFSKHVCAFSHICIPQSHWE